MASTFWRKDLLSGVSRCIFVLSRAAVALEVKVMTDMAKDVKEQSFYEKEDRCGRVFALTLRQYGGVGHLCTPGEKQPIVFKDPEDYVFTMTLMAMCAFDCPSVQVITFIIMSNHIHVVLCGSEDDVLAFFAMFKRRLQRYLAEKEQRTDLSNFTCEKPIPIETLESLRNQICYTNRNNYVVDPGQTPFSYPYGANAYYFMPAVQKWKDVCFGDLTFGKKAAGPRAGSRLSRIVRGNEWVFFSDVFLPPGYRRGRFPGCPALFQSFGKERRVVPGYRQSVR